MLTARPCPVADTDFVTAACWTPSNELYTCSDDKTICKWGMDGELISEVCKKEDVFVTGMHWFAAVGKAAAETFVICCTDGAFRPYCALCPSH